MSLWNTIENLRQKPEPARQAIALFFAIVITAVIVGLWLFLKTLPESSTPTDDIETPSPFQVLWNYIQDLWE